MTQFSYAHNDTSQGERVTPTAEFNRPHICAEIQALRKNAFARGIPTADDETLCFLQTFLSAFKPRKILELGSAVGISAAFMSDICKQAQITTIERDEAFYNEALQNFSQLGLGGRVTPVFGDVAEEIQKLDGCFDFIFLDCAKAQYVKYLPRLKQLLNDGGCLLADDVLLYGWITGETEIPKKRKMLAQHVNEYVQAVTNDGQLSTTIINAGDGLALSVKL